jgi:hypothetical protein
MPLLEVRDPAKHEQRAAGLSAVAEAQAVIRNPASAFRFLAPAGSSPSNKRTSRSGAALPAVNMPSWSSSSATT